MKLKRLASPFQDLYKRKCALLNIWGLQHAKPPIKKSLRGAEGGRLRHLGGLESKRGVLAQIGRANEREGVT